MVSFHVDYFSVTVVGIKLSKFVSMFMGQFGKIEWAKTGGRGFKKRGVMLAGVNVYKDPVYPMKDGRKNYFHIELKGKACSLLSESWFYEVMNVGCIEDGTAVSLTRIDLAFDGLDFTVSDFWGSVLEGNITTRASRQSFRHIYSPWELNELGEKGTETVYIGSFKSDRMVRVYDKHGFVRLELQLRGAWAKAFGARMDNGTYDIFDEFSRGAVKDFMNLSDKFWDAFITSKIKKVALSVYTAKMVTVESIDEWIIRQVSPSLAFFYEYYGDLEHIFELVKRGGDRLTQKHKTLLAMSNVY